MSIVNPGPLSSITFNHTSHYEVINSLKDYIVGIESHGMVIWKESCNAELTSFLRHKSADTIACPSDFMFSCSSLMSP